MSVLQIIIAPNKVFSQKSKKIEKITDDITKFCNDLIDTMKFEGAVGLGANMVGVLQRVIALDLPEGPLAMINPEIISFSEEKQTIEEASLSFPGISAEITRAQKVKVTYQDLSGKENELELTDFWATVAQHEIDYLDGVVYLDYLSKIKKEMLVKKMQKYIKMHPPHIHGEHCHH